MPFRENGSELVFSERHVGVYGVGALFLAIGVALFVQNVQRGGASSLGARLVFVALGLLIVLAVQRSTIYVRRAEQDVRVVGKRLLRPAQEQRYPLSRIAAVVQEHKVNKKNRLRFRLAFRLRDGTLVRATHTWKGGRNVDTAKVGQRLATTIGVPFED